MQTPEQKHPETLSESTSEEAHDQGRGIGCVEQEAGISRRNTFRRQRAPGLVQSIFLDHRWRSLVADIEAEQVDPEPEDDERGVAEDLGGAWNGLYAES